MIERIPPRNEIEYSMPTEVVFGRGMIKRIFEEPIISKSKRIVLITGNHFKKGEEFNLLINNFSERNKIIIVYGNPVRNSDFIRVNDLTNFVRENYPDLVISIGGGTTMDIGKCAAILARNTGRIEDYLINGKNIIEKGVSFIAVPTTAGTGSEVTPWATVWDTNNKKKYSLASPIMFPELAVVDPSLTDDLPPKITAETGMDALTQAIEAYWSKNHNPVSDNYALKSIKLILKNLEAAVNNPNRQVRDDTSQASLLAGLAFSNTKTTICHAISYPITLHWGINHGQAVSVTLPLMIKYSLSDMDEKRRSELLAAFNAVTIKNAAGKIEKIMKSIGLATKLSELGITEKDIDTIVNEGYNANRMNNAPRIPTQTELKELLKGIL